MSFKGPPGNAGIPGVPGTVGFPGREVSDDWKENIQLLIEWYNL